jgi:hypothetical protein
VFVFNDLPDLLPVGKQARREEIAAGINCLLSIVVSGNNSGALLLTILALKHRRGNEVLTISHGVIPEGRLRPIRDRKIASASVRDDPG